MSSGTDNEAPAAKTDDSSPVSARPLLASTKRPLMTRSKDGKLLSEKKLRRLEKNRLSARECRRRKREATENLERQINVLEGENLRLRLQLQVSGVQYDSILFILSEFLSQAVYLIPWFLVTPRLEKKPRIRCDKNKKR